MALDFAHVPAEVAVAAPPQAPRSDPSLFDRLRDAAGTHHTFLLPGIAYAAWHPLHPLRTLNDTRIDSSGVGVELSLVHWLGESTYLGVLGQVERIDRWRAGVGAEVGFEFIGLEVSCVREFAARDGAGAQWSLQVAPYASLGMVYVSPRWIVALSRRGEPDVPGDGAMIVVGFKIPVLVGGSAP